MADPGHGGIVRFGPAGWDYPDWAGRVYPTPKPKGFDPLRYLAGYFGVIEINSTFYRPASAKVQVDCSAPSGIAGRPSVTRP